MDFEERATALTTWRVGRLGGRYMSLFNVKDQKPLYQQEFQAAVEAFKRKPFDDRMQFYRKMEEMYDDMIKSEDYENTKEFHEMMDYFYFTVFEKEATDFLNDLKRGLK